MTNVDQFTRHVAQAKLASICGILTNEDVAGLRRRGESLGIAPRVVLRIIEKTPCAKYAPAWNGKGDL